MSAADPATAPEPILKRKLSHAVLDRLKARITSGEFQPGAHLPSERDLMALYQVGRPAIREALQQLERGGMITITHGERARIVVPTAAQLVDQIKDSAQFLLQMEPRTLDDLKEARLLMEGGFARLAAERADAAGIAALRRCLDQHRNADLDQFLACDIAFHRQIAVLTGNSIFPSMLEGMLNWLAVYHRSLVRAPGVELLTLSEHEDICNAIAAHDADRAEAAMRAHLTRASALYRR